MSDNRYNGWTNYETWAVALWIDNDQGSQEHWGGVAHEAYEEAVRDPNEDTRDQWTHSAAVAVAERLKDDLTDEESCPLLGQASVYSDLLTAALGEVNWYEIAEHMVEDCERAEIEADIRPADEDEDEDEDEATNPTE
jgi:hypothetical protein